MCGRYSLTDKDIGVVADALGAHYDDELAAAHKPRYNVAPTQAAPIVTLEDRGRVLSLARWGFVGEHDRKLAINARSESVAARPGIRDAFASRRCVVPADGFFEWRGEKSARQPIWFHRPDGQLLFFAGLWQAGTNGAPTFIVLTTKPNDLVKPVHDRMPAILTASEAGEWLKRPDVKLLGPVANDYLVATPVSARVNDVKNDDPDCLAPATEANGGAASRGGGGGGGGAARGVQKAQLKLL
jgi:putative SOS response-associated peptidase YedK